MNHHQVLNEANQREEDQLEGIDDGHEDLREGSENKLKKIEGCKNV